MTAYSLLGDRNTEYVFTTDNMLDGVAGFKALDVGPGSRAALGRYARDHGWDVTAVDLFTDAKIPGIEWRKADLRDMTFEPESFRLILNVSSIEHFGVPGRYGIKGYDADADIQAMDMMADWLSPAGRMILTLPIGPDTLHAPFHRVYGQRLDRLLAKYDIIDGQFWNKQDGFNSYRPCTAPEAFTTIPTLEPHHYYAIGGFVLEKAP